MLSAKGFMKARNMALYEDYLKTNALDVYANYITLDAGHVTRPFTPKYSDAMIARAEGTDWMGEIMRTGMQHSHNLSMTGGNGGTQYMASVNYFDQEGIIKEDGMDRFSARFNLDQQISRFVKAGVTLSLSRNKYHSVPLDYGSNSENQQYDGVIKMAAEFNPALPLYDQNGDYTKDPDRPNIQNPVSLLTVTDNSVKDRVLGSAYVEVEPVKGLLLKASLGMDRRNGKRSVYMPRTVVAGAQVNGKANISERDNIDYLMDLTATYAKQIGNHSLTALAGYSYQQFNSEGFMAGNQMFLMDNFLYNNLGSGAGEKPPVASWADKSALGSYFARVNYSFLGRYLLTATIRADGDSDFNPDYRWGYFPSASVGWRFSDEAFMQPFAAWLSNGKIRASYGQTGNSNVGNRIIDFYEQTGGMTFGDSYALGIWAGQLGNPRLRWETTTEWNIGLDLGFFDGRLNVAAEYYDRVISDLLVAEKSLPSYNEIDKIAANIGKTQGRGFELTLNTVNLKGRDFEWSTDLTYSMYRDRYLERDPNLPLAVYESADDPIRIYPATVSDGLLQPGETPPAHQPTLLPGQVKLKDLSGPYGIPDGKLDDYDVVVLGTTDPDFYFGINNTLRYKNFDLNIYFYGEVNRLAGGSYYEGGAAFVIDGQNGTQVAFETWRHDNQSAAHPSLISSDWGYGDYYTKNISYLRCRNITLGYVLPLPKKIVERARVYVDVNNPFVITNWSGLDPETDLVPKDKNGLRSSNVYPNIMSFSIGVDITF
jgi:TonB-linked SusC/RagA family outer membrane protein